MKKLRKGKIVLLLIAVALVVLIATIVIISIKNKPGEQKPSDQEQLDVIPLPPTTYSNMEVKNVQMEYLENNQETMVSLEIHNTTDKVVEDESLNAILIGPNENVLGQMQTYIKKLSPGEQYDISVVLKGDLTATTQVKLVEL